MLSFPKPSDTFTRQSSLPLLRSMAMATQILAASSVDATKTRSPQTTGVAPLGPGNGALHNTFSVRLKVAGNPSSVEEPSAEDDARDLAVPALASDEELLRSKRFDALDPSELARCTT